MVSLMAARCSPTHQQQGRAHVLPWSLSLGTLVYHSGSMSAAWLRACGVRGCTQCDVQLCGASALDIEAFWLVIIDLKSLLRVVMVEVC